MSVDLRMTRILGRLQFLLVCDVGWTCMFLFHCMCTQDIDTLRAHMFEAKGTSIIIAV